MKKNYIFILAIALLVSGCNVGNSEIDDGFISGGNSENTEKNDEFRGFHQLYEDVYVNYLPGIYDSAIDVEFKVKNENYTVYYSLDYTEPDIPFMKAIEIDILPTNDIDDYPLTTHVDGILANTTNQKVSSNNYINNIQTPNKYPTLDRCNVITISVKDEVNEVEILNRSLTYIIDKESKYLTIPIVSLSMPFKDWFGSKGMYNDILNDTSKRVNLEYFDSVLNETFYVNSKIKLGGNYSKGYPQRTLNLNFNKDQNGNKNKPINVDIFDGRTKRGFKDEPLTGLTRFRLHNGGNCFESWTGFNDALIHNLFADTNVATSACRPCIGFLNGEYWGIYYIREHYSDVYFENNYNVDKDNVVIYEYKGVLTFDDGNEELGKECFEEFNQFINSCNLTISSQYEKLLDEYIDIDSFIDFIIANHYAGNWDSVGNNNNMKMWRAIDEEKDNEYTDGKWRFCLHDLDFAFTDYNNYLLPTQDFSYSKFPLLKKLLKVKDFRDRLYARAEELMETILTSKIANNILAEMVDSVADYKKEAGVRWGQPDSFYKDWEKSIRSTRDFINHRTRIYLDFLKDALSKY